MATKNLARTAIEGGRASDYKDDVAEYAASERAAARAFLRAVLRDVDVAEAVSVPMRRPAYLSFADKLAPIRAFLDSRVGKSWNKTRALIAQRFDTRTTPGRHIVENHIFDDIALSGEHELKVCYGRSYRYYVDRGGILRLNPGRYQRFRPRPVPPGPSTEQVLAWLGNRRVGQQGGRFVWFVPTQNGSHVQAVWDGIQIVWTDLDAAGRPIRDLITYPEGSWYRWQPRDRVRVTTSPFRAAGLLGKADEAFFLSVRPGLRKQVLDAAPGGKSGRS